MWLLLAFLSAALLGFYDAFKKQALKDNAVLPVLFLNTVFSSLIFLPFILVSCFAPAVLGGTMFDVPVVGWDVHKFIIIKSFIVLSSWIFVSDEAAAAYGGAVMVQHLSGVYHVSHYPAVVVSQEKGKYTVPLGLDYHRYIRLSLCGRLCVFLCLEL